MGVFGRALVNEMSNFEMGPMLLRIRFKMLWQKVLLLLVPGLWLACTSPNRESELAEHKPRIDKPLKLTEAPEKKLLAGLFVDVNTKASAPNGKSWDSAFPTIMDAVRVASGQDIYVAPGTYKRPNIDLRDKKNLRLIGGYKAGELYQKENFQIESDEWAILDGDGGAQPLIEIRGSAEKIAIIGGFVFQNVIGQSAVVIAGDAADRRVKDITIVHSRFENNHNNAANGNGGGVRIQWVENLRLENIDAKGNKTDSRGGYLYAENVNNLTLINGIIESNETTAVGLGIGGGVYLSGVSRLTVRNLTVKDNSSAEAGGIFFDNLRGEEISDIEFSNNKASNIGGGLSVRRSHNMMFSRLSFTGNEVLVGGDFGGGFHANDVQGLTINFADKKIENNKNRGDDGGFLAVNNSSNVHITGGTFSQNEATRHGGTMFLEDSENVTVTNSKISDGRAQNGAGMYVNRPGRLFKLEKVTFEKNQATGMGGGLVVLDRKAGVAPNPEVSIKDVDFIKNSSVGNGGAVFTQRISYLFGMSKTSFEENKSSNYGGGLALDGKTSANARFVIGAETKFLRNRSDRNFGGGAILAVFNEANAVGALPLPQQRQLVFYIGQPDIGGNNAGNSLSGQFMRVTNHDVDHVPPVGLEANPNLPAPPLMPINPLAEVFWQQINPPANTNRRLKHFIAYSTDVADDTAPWNAFKFNWETSRSQVYSW